MQDLQVFLEAMGRNESGFEDMIGRIRRRWQGKLDAMHLKEAESEAPHSPHPESEDFCLPMSGMQRSRACSLFRASCETYEPNRCMVSL